MDPLDVELLRIVQVQDYINVACLALWAYDYFTTLISEVSLVWRSPWSIPKVLFFFTRYVVFITLFVTLYFARFTNWMINISLCITECSAFDAPNLGGVWPASWHSSLPHRGDLNHRDLCVIPTYSFLSAVMVPRQVRLSGCYAIITSKLTPLNYALTVAFYIVTLSLMSIKAYQCLNSGMDTKFTRIVYLDGTLYYVYLFSISLANLIMNFVLPLGYRGLLSTLQQLLNSMLACRMVLHLRELGKQTTHSTFELPYIDVLAFTHTDLEHE
ncbi:hypothetical protein Hypma_016390 [Hypsizygus marmoreus]|uniref:DUF6533 domain-containing protein n=1 Tax=Hypsizygus marmoreus TaxID=39966 RepID=A0A369J5E7_HYPMA|nr:hypothetical protein Hypma_016390 [Hypsizygus marmoreus]